MRGRIFICHHSPPRHILSTSLFATLQSGVGDDPATGLIGDLAGTNIATPNWHSEMRHQYHVLHDRMAGLDYVGFEHHRRIFTPDILPAVDLFRVDPALLAVSRCFCTSDHQVTLFVDDEVFQRCLEFRTTHDSAVKAAFDRLMQNHDIVTQRPFGLRIDEDWRTNHPPHEWDLLVETVRQSRFYRECYELIDFSMCSIRYCNMYIMRAALFYQYMEFWTECMARLETLIDKRERHFGYLSERLVNFFIYGKRMVDPTIRLGTLPYVTCRS